MSIAEAHDMPAATRRLLALDGTTSVAPSIDPFFFKVKG